MPKVNLEAIEKVNRTGYPPPHDEQVAAAGPSASRRRSA